MSKERKMRLALLVILMMLTGIGVAQGAGEPSITEAVSSGVRVYDRDVSETAAISQTKIDITSAPENTSYTNKNYYLMLPTLATGDIPAASGCEGSLVYDTTLDSVYYSNGTSWTTVTGGSLTFLGLSDTPAAYGANKILKVNTGATAVEFVTLSGDGSINATGTLTISDLSIASEATGDIVYFDGTNWKRLAKGTQNYPLVAGASIPGYALLNVAGISLAEGNLIIGNASAVGAALDIGNTNAGIPIGNGTTAAIYALTGDVAMTNAGVTTVTDLTITGEATGSVVYFDGTNWVRLVKGTSGQFLKIGASIPEWATVTTTAADTILDHATLNDAGLLDAVLSFTQQTGSAPTLTVPDFAGVNDEFVFKTKAVTLANKTLTSPDINGGTWNGTVDGAWTAAGQICADLGTVTTADINAGTVDAITSLTAANALDIGAYDLRALTFTSDQATGTAPFTVASTTVVTNLNADTVDAKGATAFVLVDGTQALTADWDAGAFEIRAQTLESDVATGTAPLTIASTTVVANLNVDKVDGQDAPTGNIVGHTDAQTLTNKTIDVDANTVSNINADEADPVTVPTDAAPAFVSSVPFVLSIDITNAVTTTITNNAPFKFRIIDAWSVSTSADGGTWKLYTGAADIVPAVTVAASDKDIDRAIQIDDATAIISATGTLQVVTDGGLDAQIYISCIRVD